MTDKEKTIAFLNDLNIPFEDNGTYIRIKEGTTKDGIKFIDGYCDFFLDFDFDDTGKFHNVGIWE